MKFITTILLAVLFSHVSFSQKAVVNEFSAIDKKALLIPQNLTNTTDQIASYISSNFRTDLDKSRAAFIWVASTISYDLENMYVINFEETSSDRIASTLKTRKGICENYAALLNEILNKVGVKSFVVAGYTKQNEAIDQLSHAWNAAYLDGAWYIFDPTWGSGYVSGNRFTKEINNKFFKVRPEISIKTHMPFDYLWQFLEYPITNQEFYDSKTQQNKAKVKYNFTEELATYERQSEVNQLRLAATRVEKNGVKNALIFERLKYLKLAAENIQQNLVVTQFNNASASYNEGIAKYNDFINYRNRQFKPQVSDHEIQTIIDDAARNLEKAKTILREIPVSDASTTTLVNQLKIAAEAASNNILEQKEWLKIYLSKGKIARKSMFYERKPSLFGVPIN